jgi:hypothetical protein
MSVGHRSHLLEGGRAIHTALISNKMAPDTQEPVAPHQITCPDCPQLARAMAMPYSWALTPSIAINRL